MKSWFFKIFAVLISTFCCLLAGEVFSAWWISHNGDPLLRAMRILESDPELWWRQRNNLITVFEHQEVRTGPRGLRDEAEPLQKYEAVVLGPSSAFGWGVRGDDTYASQWAHISKRETLNAGQIGYSVFQGERLFAKLVSDGLHPKTVAIAYGVNDLDHFRFFGLDPVTDEDHDVHQHQATNDSFGFLSHWALGILTSRALSESHITAGCGLRKMPSLRMPLDRFDAVLEKLLKKISTIGSRAILIDTASNYPKSDFQPEASDAFYKQSAAAAERGQCSESMRLLREARRSETPRLVRDIGALNSQLKLFARRNNLQLVEASILLNEPADFVDPIHPSARGHQKIAAALNAASDLRSNETAKEKK